MASKRLSQQFKNEDGMTLIEIVIAILILVVISTATAFNIRKSVTVKARVEQDLDDYSAVRDALVIITRDVNSAFHYVDINEEIKKKIIAEAAAAGKPPPFPSPSQTNNSVPTEKLTGFEGDRSSLYLTTLSHVRTIADTPESDQAKIGYYLKDVKSAKNGTSTKGLIRREATFLDGGDLQKGGRETLLIENISELKFRYLGGDDKDWVDSWKSESGMDDTTKNRFPDAVEVTITTDRGGRKVTLSTVAALHMPNNDLFKARVASSPGQGGQGGLPLSSPTR